MILSGPYDSNAALQSCYAFITASLFGAELVGQAELRLGFLMLLASHTPLGFSAPTWTVKLGLGGERCGPGANHRIVHLRPRRSSGEVGEVHNSVFQIIQISDP